MRVVMDAKLAHAVAWDAGNRHARKAGRTVWNEDDYDAACDAYEHVYPAEQAIADAQARYQEARKERP